MQRSGTGSQTNIGRGSPSGFLLMRIVLTRSMQRSGLQIRWKHFDARSSGEDAIASASRRSLGVVYLKARFSEASYPFQPRVVRRVSSVRAKQKVCQDSIWASIAAGKSDPRSAIHPTVFDRVGAGENKRAPTADHVPAPPKMLKTDGVGGR